MMRPQRPDHRAVTDLARQLGALLKELDLAAIEVTVGGLTVRLQRQAPPAAISVPAAPMAHPGAGAVVAGSAPVADVVGPTLITIESPMVGTFYRASSPTATPYVNEGDVVKEGQVLCVIEAMKLMNEIESRTSGRIAKILVENTQPVEYGQPLFLIDPAG